MKSRIELQSLSTQRKDAGFAHLIGMAIRAGLPLVVVVVLVAWTLAQTGLPTPVAPPGAIFVLTAITLVMVGVMRWFRQRFGIARELMGHLPDPLFTMYLATVILVGMPAGVVLAAVTPIVESLPDLLQRRAEVVEVLRQSAAATTTTFLTGVTYLVVSAMLSPWLTTVRAHFAGAIVASVVTFGGLAVTRAMEMSSRPGTFAGAWWRYLRSPAIRFQVLLLSVGPLLPLAELLDDAEAEFAWILFLVPLFSVYYLALVSVRLQQRTGELQDTIQLLGVSRRREAELSDYAALVTRAQEDERRRLARELHDDTAQALIALSRGLDALASRQVNPPLSSIDTRFIHELGDLANRTLESVRRACQDLRPSVLDDLGLSAALESLAHSMTQRGLACSFRQVGEDRELAPEVQVTVYRIAQEALSNARQHAEASRASLDVVYLPSGLELTVADNGKGFNYEEQLAAYEASSHQEPETRAGLGLLGMRERAGLIGARLVVETRAGQGTTVRLVTPSKEG